MILITGGNYQGKEAFANTLKTADTELVLNLHEYVRENVDDAEKVYAFANELIEKNNVIVTIAEVGSGVVPIDKNERVWRELSGRVGCKLAEASDEVYRVVCGIATRIK